MSKEEQKNNLSEKKQSNRTLKIWNGRGHGRYQNSHHAYVAAYSMKQAAELLSIAFYGKEHTKLISASEISKYYHGGAWGNFMQGIEATEPCVYLHRERNATDKPFRVV